MSFILMTVDDLLHRHTKGHTEKETRWLTV